MTFYISYSLLFFFTPTVIQKLVVSRQPGNIVRVRLPSGQREELLLSDTSVSATSPNNLLIYHPRFGAVHGSNLAALFFNMEAIFPCIESANYSPTCGILTYEEDGFFQGRSFIQAADDGNSFRIFSSTENIRTYGIAVQTCEEFNLACLPEHTAFTVVCLLPREQCG